MIIRLHIQRVFFQKILDIGICRLALGYKLILGFSVLNRSKAGVTLTNYGEHLLPYVNVVLNSDESLQQAIAEFNGLKQGKVKVGCFSSVCTNWLPVRKLPWSATVLKT